MVAMRPLRLFVLPLVVSLSACAPHVQRARVDGPATRVAPAAPAASAASVAATGGDPTADLPEAGPRWLIAPAATRLEIRSWAAPLGQQVFTFRRFRAHVVGDQMALFHAEIDTTSLEGGSAGVAPFVRGQLLEVGRFPRAVFVGSVHRTAGDGCTVDGALTLHGVTRTLRFDGTVHDEGEALHFSTSFTVPRSAFDVRLPAPWDIFVPEDVEVVLDLVATREHVVVEQPD
jgi:polyisoprenoid-binding protein YceI